MAPRHPGDDLETASIVVVTGPPCSGKSTYVREHRRPEDLVVDTDAIAHALGYPTSQITWTLEHAARDAARVARIALLDWVLAGPLDADVWIVETDPAPVLVGRLERVGATFVDLDPGLDVCLARAAARPDPTGTAEQIRQWYGVGEQQRTRWAL